MKKSLRALAIIMLLAIAVTSMPVTALADVRVNMVGGVEWIDSTYRFEIEH